MTRQDDNPDEPHTSNTTVQCNWSDELFLKKFAFLGACNARPDLSTGTLAAKALINWYMGGERPENLTDVLLATLYSMTLNQSSCRDVDCDGPLFSDQLMKDGPDLQLPNAVERIYPKKYKSSLMQIIMPQDKNLENTALTLESAIKWYDKIWTMLEDECDKQKQTAINVMGFLYMTLLRLSVKQVSSVSKYILEKSMKSYQTMWGYEYLYPSTMFCPPHDPMALCFKREFARFQPCYMKIMSAIVYSYYKGLQGQNKWAIQRVFKASCLASLEKVGLGLLTWTYKAAAALHMSAKEFFNYICEKGDRRHMNVYLSFSNWSTKFVLTYQVTWPWARLFEDGALADLRTAEDPMYVMDMVALVHLYGKIKDVWNIPSLKKEYVATHKEEAIARAKRIQEDIKSSEVIELFKYYERVDE